MTTPKSRQQSARSLSERDKLARDLFLNFCCTAGHGGRTPEHIAGDAINKANAFFDALEKHNKSK